MKKILILSAIAISGLIYNTANAQPTIQVGLRLGAAGITYSTVPVYNGDDDDFYYLPDVGAYYDVDAQCYFYFNGEQWVETPYLPGVYRDYDWRNARRFEIRERRPFMRDDFYRSRYEGYRVTEWAHPNYNNHFDGGYANRRDWDGDRFDNRDRDRHRFDNREQRGYNQRGGQYRDNDDRFDNRGQGGFRRPELNRQNGQRFDNRGQGGFRQPEQNRQDGQRFDNRGQGGFRQPEQNRQNGQRFDNRGQGAFQQPVQNRQNGQRFDNRGQGNNQPENVNHARDNRGGNSQFVQNNQRGRFDNRKMAKF